MYYAYASDPRMKLNLGIRRRLAPLLDNDRRRIELLNCLLLHAARQPDRLLRRRDRHGRQRLPRRPQRRAHADAVVGDRNAGFSTADPAQLYLPVITDPVYGYQAVNVAAQEKHAVVAAEHDEAAHRRAPALARVRPRHHRVPAAAQPVGARLRPPLAGRHDARSSPTSPGARSRSSSTSTALEGAVPVEMLGDTRFPPIGREPYFLSPRPARLLLVPAARAASAAPCATASRTRRFEPGRRRRPRAWIAGQRWFAAKSRRIDAVARRGRGSDSAAGTLWIVAGDARRRQRTTATRVPLLEGPDVRDALDEPDFGRALLDLIAREARGRGRRTARWRGTRTRAWPSGLAADVPARRLERRAEQHVGRVRRRAHPQALPAPRRGCQPRASRSPAS